MADHTITGTDVAWHGTITVDVETITFDRDQATVSIMSRDGAGTLWYTVNGDQPTENGPTSYALPAGVIGTDERQVPTTGETVVKIIATSPTAATIARGQ